MITQGAQYLPFIYYYFPAKSGLIHLICPPFYKNVKTAVYLRCLALNLRDTKLFDLQAGLEVGDGRYKFFYGADEMLLSGLAWLGGGAHGAIGSTSTTLPLPSIIGLSPLYNKKERSQNRS